jgi:hypothetical protein
VLGLGQLLLRLCQRPLVHRAQFLYTGQARLLRCPHLRQHVCDGLQVLQLLPQLCLLFQQCGTFSGQLCRLLLQRVALLDGLLVLSLEADNFSHLLVGVDEERQLGLLLAHQLP